MSLNLYVIYKNAHDDVKHLATVESEYCMRLHTIGPDTAEQTEHVVWVDDIETLRAEMIRQGHRCFPRSINDDPAVVETWIYIPNPTVTEIGNREREP